MKNVHLLLVEDNEGDILLTREALEGSKIINKISVVRNGKAALDFIFKKGDFENADTPDLVLLDVNLPLKNGHEVLQAVKEDKSTQHLPIVMLTTSSSENDIQLSYKHQANCYITKPVDVEDFLHAILSIEDFWLNLVTLPRSE
ncbi:response regulator [Marivirga sp. S37H4]|uniref:Response regulator n=1 Tax=Marivirga aurantiaca TaxID=2802615 RepID=A0A934WYX8_9BACT|nr:response regulator [Marivirga aurantiaca]MBK6265758.1 response regulator [Marivirga aurantiaca]